MKRSLQLVVDVRLARASLRLAMTEAFDRERGIMQTKLAARSKPLRGSPSAPMAGLEQCTVRESHSRRSPASMWGMIGGVNASSGSSMGNRKWSIPESIRLSRSV